MKVCLYYLYKDVAYQFPRRVIYYENPLLSGKVNRQHHGGRITLEAPRPNAPSVALRGGLRFLCLAEFVRYNRSAIGRLSKRQPMKSLVSSCLGSTCNAQTPFARYWRAIKAAANNITPQVIAQTPKVIKLVYKNKIGEN